MRRREVLEVLGAAVVAPLLVPLSPERRWGAGALLHRRVAQGAAGQALNPAQLAQVRALADAILPRTDIPGAVDVGAAEFIDLLLAEWYPADERRRLLDGLEALEARCRAERGAPLAELPADARAAFVGGVDGRPGDPGSAEWTYGRLKDSVVFAFLTSRPIAPLANPMPIIPGRFDGCIPVGPAGGSGDAGDATGGGGAA